MKRPAMPAMPAMPTLVHFRVFRDTGEVIALFPEEPADRYGALCESYMHVGQHSTASPDLTHCTRRAMPQERAALWEELERIGYKDLRDVARITQRMHETRRAAARQS